MSGLAVGIDAVAHSCAVEHGTPTIGVLACGQLVNYPAENEELKRHIVAGGGAVISELLPHAGVEGRYFHQRNRMISGLGLGTLVVEASTRSGCLITANHAIEQGRDLFCVPPGDITRESCAGVVQFLRDGAIPVVRLPRYRQRVHVSLPEQNTRRTRHAAVRRKNSTS